MKITVKEFVKLDIQGLMQINGGTSACGNYSKTQPAPKNNPNNDTPNNNNNGSGITVGGCSSINGGNGNGDGKVDYVKR